MRRPRFYLTQVASVVAFSGRSHRSAGTSGSYPSRICRRDKVVLSGRYRPFADIRSYGRVLQAPSSLPAYVVDHTYIRAGDLVPVTAYSGTEHATDLAWLHCCETKVKLVPMRASPPAASENHPAQVA
jgi:hypothetical protein